MTCTGPTIRSLGLLTYLQPDLNRLPVVVVGTYRPDEILADHPLRRLLDQLAGGVHRIELLGLPPPDIAAVAASYAGIDVDELDGVALCATTGGNPLFARELARLLGDGVASRHEHALPDSVRAVIERSVDVGRRAGSFNAELLNLVQRSNLHLLQGASTAGATAFLDMIDGYDGASSDPAVIVITAAVTAMYGDIEAARDSWARARRDGFQSRFDSEWLGTTACAMAGAVLLEEPRRGTRAPHTAAALCAPVLRGRHRRRSVRVDRGMDRTCDRAAR